MVNLRSATSGNQRCRGRSGPSPSNASQCHDVALKPLGKRPKVFGEPMRSCFEGAQVGKPGDENAVLTVSTGVAEADFECFAFLAYAAGDT